jgi:cytosine/uracil/thiamine/allantoin permease
MEYISVTEWIGYLASAFLMISFMMKDVKKLRMINSLGCIAFVLYGLQLKAWPIVITNGFILLLNLYHLIVLKKD